MSIKQVISLICIVSIFVLAVLYLVVDYGWIIPQSHKYSVNFENNQTHSDGDLSIVVGKNGLESPKLLNLHGLGNKTMILSSILSTETGKVIDSLKFQGKYKVPLNLSIDNLTSVEVSVPNPESGKYYGWLYLTNGSTFTIPIILSTEPKVIQTVILVVIGVLLSVIFWEIFFISNKKFNQTTANTLRNATATDLESRFPNLVAAARTTKRDKMVERKDNRVTKVDSRYTENTIKIASFDVASVVFGIVTGLVGVMSNSYVTTSIEITPAIAATLIGTGLGIGSLKGLVDN
jgi:hypothetical protein